ncbi:TPA: hypothetical protein ACGUVR_004038 [Vibrio vulnificus]
MVIIDVQTSSSDESIAEYIEGMPSLELPPHFEKLLKQPFDLQGADFEVQYGIRNEQGHIYRYHPHYLPKPTCIDDKKA